MSKTIADTFTASEVSHLTGVNTETLRVWRRRGHFSIEAEAGGWTRYTFNDVLKIATFSTMVAQGMVIPMAERIAESCPEQYAILSKTPSNGPEPFGVFARSPMETFYFSIADGLDEVAQHLSILSRRQEYSLIQLIDYTKIFYALVSKIGAMGDDAEANG